MLMHCQAEAPCRDFFSVSSLRINNGTTPKTVLFPPFQSMPEPGIAWQKKAPYLQSSKEFLRIYFPKMRKKYQIRIDLLLSLGHS